MISLFPASKRGWRGTSLILVAVLMPVLLGFVALAIDTAVLATARAQLKTAADAGALAGVWPLADDSRLSGTLLLSTEIANAQAQAKAAAQANFVLGQAAVIFDNPSN